MVMDAQALTHGFEVHGLIFHFYLLNISIVLSNVVVLFGIMKSCVLYASLEKSCNLYTSILKKVKKSFNLSKKPSAKIHKL